MKGRPRKPQREKDLTARFLSDSLDEDRLEQQQRFGQRSRQWRQSKMQRTALLRASEEEVIGAVDALPVGQVIQVYSLFSEVESGGKVFLCVVRKTLASLSDSQVVVGDLVRLRTVGAEDEQGRPEAVIEQVLPRKTILTRADSFKAIESQPIVANADQMLIVAALAEPWPKWGLIDRMLVAANSGGLSPIICLNKLDLANQPVARKQIDTADAAMNHYASLGVKTLRTAVPLAMGLDELRDLLSSGTTVLAGHSGVGKSSLVRAIAPALDLRVGEISSYTGKGRHTTTSARRYPLEGGGYVVDTPGVKLFGLWNVSRENLAEFFPDVEAGTAPLWREESYQRIMESLPA